MPADPKHCEQCDQEIPEDDKLAVEVWLGDLDADEPPFVFCWAGCAGLWLTDLSVA